MPSPAPLSPSLVDLIRQCAATRPFRGEASVETANTVYRFKDGAFTSMGRKPARSFEAPRGMLGLVLIGFLSDEGGKRSISPRFRPGTHAILWNPGAIHASAFVVTSEVVAFSMEDEDPLLESGIRRKSSCRPDAVVNRNSPDSMTRLFAAAG